ncbi:MAG TPA: restriction endonuclease [Gemmatimonadaceae bacterium]|nr:restriction endonuclease [Gemmatimonadaceae bacterium]
MGDPRSLLPHEVEIFVTRELRKAGLAPAAMKVRDRELAAGKTDDYMVELGCSLRIGDSDRFVLIECRNQAVPVGTVAIEALHTKVRQAKAHGAMMFSAAGFEADAVRLARDLGMPLLTVADGKTAFARSPWGMAGDPPAWVPEYMAEFVELDVTGQPRTELLASGGSKRILDAWIRSQESAVRDQESGVRDRGR